MKMSVCRKKQNDPPPKKTIQPNLLMKHPRKNVLNITLFVPLTLRCLNSAMKTKKYADVHTHSSTHSRHA